MYPRGHYWDPHFLTFISDLTETMRTPRCFSADVKVVRADLDGDRDSRSLVTQVGPSTER